MLFHNSENLSWLLVLIFCILIYCIQVQIRNKRVKKWLGKQRFFLRGLISEKKRHLKITLQLLALLFFIIALARPQIEGEKVDLERSGVFIALMVDVSQSMLAEDVKPNRLSFMKQELGRFLDLSQGDQVALIAFAHSAVLVSPFTQDLAAIKSYLRDLTPDYFTNQGTHFGRAFNFAEKTFKNIREKKNQTSVKVIVMASDGEDHSKTSKDKIKKLLEQNIRVFTLSFGTEKGGVIPIKNKREELLEYKKNPQGKIVVSKLNNQDLKNFARLGKGAYYHVTYGGESIKQLRSSINRLEKTIFESSSFIKNKEIYFWFLIIGLILAAIELLLNDRSFKTRSGKR